MSKEPDVGCVDLEMGKVPDVGTSSIVSVLTSPVVGPSGSPSESSIFRVHKKLREVNEKAYEPDIVSIGPYHRGKPGLQMMEVRKKLYLQLFLKQRNEDAKRYIDALRLQEERARRFYAEYVSLTPDEFVEMMLLDGLFIIEVILRFGEETITYDGLWTDLKDPIFRMQWTVNSLQRDLMLFENQLPLFVLIEILDTMRIPLITSHDVFFKKALKFFKDLLPSANDNLSLCQDIPLEIHHLLELVHKSWGPPLSVVESGHDSGRVQEILSRGSIPGIIHGIILCIIHHLLELMFRSWLVVRGRHGSGLVQERASRGFIPSTTELQEAGVELKAASRTLFDIKFEGGVIQVPSLTIEDRTETFFRNLIAYEQYCPSHKPSPLTDYVRFLDCLIDTSKDVQILSSLGIINNWLGDDEVVSTMFNKISEAVVVPRNTFQYVDIFKVNKHCSMIEYRWMATLKRDYFNSPWALISVSAALILLFLASTQTYFTVFPRK